MITHPAWARPFPVTRCFRLHRCCSSSITSSFAAAGSLVVLLVWVYYSAQIFLLGAEFTWVYANEHGSLAPNAKNAAIPAENLKPKDERNKPVISQPRQPRDAPEARETSSPMLARDGSGDPTLKQRAIVYAGSAAAIFALRLLLKQRALKRVRNVPRA